MPDIASITAALSSINSAIDIAKAIKETNTYFNEAAFKLQLADLMLSLANSKVQIANITDLLLEKDIRIKELEEKTSKIYANDKPALQWGCYKFEGTEGLFCPACWENNQKKNTNYSPWRKISPVSKLPSNACLVYGSMNWRDH